MNAPVVDERSAINMIARIESYHASISQLPPVDLPLTHHFAEGLYAREMFIPAGTVVAGKIHKRENLLIVSMGELAIVTADGPKRIKAPYTVVSPPGTKRMVFAITDVVCTAIHPTHERDLAKIEAHFIAQDLTEYLAYKAGALPDHEWDSFEWEQLL